MLAEEIDTSHIIRNENEISEDAIQIINGNFYWVKNKFEKIQEKSKDKGELPSISLALTKKQSSYSKNNELVKVLRNINIKIE